MDTQRLDANDLRFSVSVLPGTVVSLLEADRVDLDEKEWQVVEIPLTAFKIEGSITALRFSGNSIGTYTIRWEAWSRVAQRRVSVSAADE